MKNKQNQNKNKPLGNSPGAFIVALTHFNYFIIHPPAQPFRRGYTHIHLFSAVFECIFLTSQPEQSFFVRCKITLCQEPVYIFLCEHI
nr:MAG TPA: hypothetical protein [Caudoviricetes sp.]